MGFVVCNKSTYAALLFCCSESEVEKEPVKDEVDERQQLMAEVDERKRKMLREVEVRQLGFITDYVYTQQLYTQQVLLIF